MQVVHRGLQMLVLPVGAALAAVGVEFLRQHTQRLAGLALAAVRPVGKHATAAKTACHQRRVDL